MSFVKNVVQVFVWLVVAIFTCKGFIWVSEVLTTWAKFYGQTAHILMLCALLSVNITIAWQWLIKPYITVNVEVEKQ